MVGKKRNTRDERSAQAWRLARGQHGVLTRRDLLAFGFGSRSIEHRLHSGRLYPVYRGVYAVGRRQLSREVRQGASRLHRREREAPFEAAPSGTPQPSSPLSTCPGSHHPPEHPPLPSLFVIDADSLRRALDDRPASRASAISARSSTSTPFGSPTTSWNSSSARSPRPPVSRPRSPNSSSTNSRSTSSGPTSASSSRPMAGATTAPRPPRPATPSASSATPQRA